GHVAALHQHVAAFPAGAVAAPRADVRVLGTEVAGIAVRGGLLLVAPVPAAPEPADVVGHRLAGAGLAGQPDHRHVPAAAAVVDPAVEHARRLPALASAWGHAGAVGRPGHEVAADP